MADKFFSEEPLPGAKLSPIQFKKPEGMTSAPPTQSPQTPMRDGWEIIKEIDALLQDGQKGSDVFMKQIEDYALSHPREIEFYARHIQERLSLMQIFIFNQRLRDIHNATPTIKPPPDDEIENQEGEATAAR